MPSRLIRGFFYVEAGDGDDKEKPYDFIINKSFQTIFEEPFRQGLSVSEIVRFFGTHTDINLLSL